MLKDRYYYADPYLREFKAEVVKRELDGNSRLYVVLDNTAFYPTGGGQPHDTGMLNGIYVVDVEEVDGEIRHYIEEPLEIGNQVEGEIDWLRRFDHMQQHAGQHILTAAFVELFGYQTVSFHLGKEMVSIDLDAEEVTPEQLSEVERLANQIVLENRPIETKFITEEELANYKLRKALAVTGEIRLVIIPHFDYNGCGGTHPSSTGQVRAIKILSTERQKKKMRIHFVCGERVLDQLHKKTNVLAEATKLLSAPEEEVPEAIGKILTMNRYLEKSLETVRGELLVFEAKGLVNEMKENKVEATFVGRSIQELQKLARIAVAENPNAIVLFVAENEDKLQFVAAKGDAVEHSMKDVSAVVLPAINGKGGGNDLFVQGGGERVMSANQLLIMMSTVIR